VEQGLGKHQFYTIALRRMSHQRLFPSFPVPHMGHFVPLAKIVALLFSDDFTTDTIAAGIWTVMAGTWEVVTGFLKGTGAKLQRLGIKAGNTAWSNYEFEYRVLAVAQNFGADGCFLYWDGLGFPDPAGHNDPLNCYSGEGRIGTGTTYPQPIWRYIDGDATLLAETALPAGRDMNVWWSFKFARWNSNLRYECIDDGVVTEAVDATHTSGLIGFSPFSGGASIEWHFDDTEVRKLSSYKPSLNPDLLVRCSVIGDGTYENPFRPEIADVEGIEKWSAIIPYNKPLKEVSPTAWVGIKAPSHVLETIKGMSGVETLDFSRLETEVREVEGRLGLMRHNLNLFRTI